MRSFLIVALASLPLMVATPVRSQALRPAPIPTVGGLVFDLPLEPGLTQRVLYDAPPHPRATLVMLPGGTGDIGVSRDGELHHDHNFVVRTRANWVAHGFAVLIPDTIDHANLRGRRSSPAYARVVDRLAAFAHREAEVPVFLLGTSQGTIAAVNGAAHAPAGLLAGLVLTEAVTVPGRRSRTTVFDVDPAAVRVPTLVVANEADRCDVAPPAMATRIADALRNAPSVEVARIDGGEERSRSPCGSLSPHGYFGVESQVLDIVTAWLLAHGAAPIGTASP